MSSLKIIVFSIVLGMLVLFTLAQGVLISGIWNPSWNFYRASADEVVEDALEQMKKLHSYHILQEFGLVVNTENEGRAEMTLKGEGDMKDREDGMQDADVALSLHLEVRDPEETSSAMSLDLNGEMKIIGEDIYVKIHQIPEFFGGYLGSSEMSMVEQFENKWVKFSIDDLAQLSSIGRQIEIPQRDRAKEKELKEKIKEIIFSSGFYTVEKELNDEKIDGVSAYHYQISVDAPQMIKELSPQINSSFKEFFEIESMGRIFGQLKIELWIGKKDHQIRKIAIRKDIPLREIFGSFREEENDGVINFTYTGTYSKLNEQISIEPPANAMPLLERLEELLQEAREREKDARIQAAFAQLKAVGQLVYMDKKANSYNQLCAQSKLNINHLMYGFQMSQIEDDIVDQDGASPVCYATPKNFCISTIMPSGEALCVSSTGATGSSVCVSAITACK